jgi:murein DD-endopeptidase MepM/ murein hydrolase activator NlpD
VHRAAIVAIALVLLTIPAGARAASADVAALQVALRAAGTDPGTVDGVTGPRTRTAIRAFQARRHLAVDGVAGPRTRAALGRRWTRDLGARALSVGARGSDVAALQFLLQARGFGPGTVDGDFGPGTIAAVRRYQQSARLGVDGVAGGRTVGALRTRLVAVTSTPVRFLRPVGGAWTDGFGFVGGRRHTGLDFPRGAGTPVGAAGRGTVSFAGSTSGGYGNLVVVRHRLGYETWYAHLATIAVAAGQSVAGGSILGTVGSTGRSTGPHLHFEARHFGTPIDPVAQLLTARSAGRATAARVRSAPLRCPPNADARGTRDADPARARLDRCP